MLFILIIFQNQQNLQLNMRQLPSVDNIPTAPSVPGEDENLDIDALTPSINNYQPQIVSETIKRDALFKGTIYQFLYIYSANFVNSSRNLFLYRKFKSKSRIRCLP